MTDSRPHAVYGTLPPLLLQLPADAVQFSPLIAGSQKLEECAPQSLAGATILAPPGTLERRYVLACALQALPVGAPLTALALKDKGGSRIAAELRAFGCEVAETSRSHFRICSTTRPAMLAGIDEARAEGGPRQYLAHKLWTQPGIFSWDRMDEGTSLLLKQLPRFCGRGADLGCGLGALGAAVLQSPDVTAMTLVDNDRRAVEMARRNIADPRAAFLWVDIRHDPLPLKDLDFVVMNAPFHDAGTEDKSLGQHFIQCAAALLKHGGSCWMVANRHLPYEALLAKHFTRVELIAEADGFKIYAAEE